MWGRSQKSSDGGGSGGDTHDDVTRAPRVSETAESAHLCYGLSSAGDTVHWIH